MPEMRIINIPCLKYYKTRTSPVEVTLAVRICSQCTYAIFLTRHPLSRQGRTISIWITGSAPVDVRYLLTLRSVFLLQKNQVKPSDGGVFGYELKDCQGKGLFLITKPKLFLSQWIISVSILARLFPTIWITGFFVFFVVPSFEAMGGPPVFTLTGLAFSAPGRGFLWPPYMPKTEVSTPYGPCHTPV